MGLLSMLLNALEREVWVLQKGENAFWNGGHWDTDARYAMTFKSSEEAKEYASEELRGYKFKVVRL